MRGAGKLALATLACLAALWMASSIQAAGSWVASAPPLTVAVPGRVASSGVLLPADPARVGGQGIAAVSWRFRLPAGRALEARLCQADRCLMLATSRGRRTAPQAWRADAPLRFRFRLPEGERRALRVEDLQVIVEHRRRAPSHK
ncbi:flagellar protein FlhE [Halomonas sp. YLGW01]|uniref:flagellar protein FlhE n=1 Tax=Halomonas sp. YLGW01 TaxID=2773308 RepID=UPI0017857F95|nr:flagellar protein FlhE [Halomonas sp. YLGW01]